MRALVHVEKPTRWGGSYKVMHAINITRVDSDKAGAWFRVYQVRVAIDCDGDGTNVGLIKQVSTGMARARRAWYFLSASGGRHERRTAHACMHAFIASVERDGKKAWEYEHE